MLNKEHLNEIGLNKIYLLTKELNKYLKVKGTVRSLRILKVCYSRVSK